MKNTHSMKDIAKHIKSVLLVQNSKRVHQLPSMGLTVSFLPRQGPVDRIKVTWHNGFKFGTFNARKNVAILRTKRKVALKNIVGGKTRPLWVIDAKTPMARRKTMELASLLGLHVQGILDLPTNILGEILEKTSLQNTSRFAQVSKRARNAVRNTDTLPTSKELDNIAMTIVEIGTNPIQKRNDWKLVRKMYQKDYKSLLVEDRKLLRNIFQKYRTLDKKQFQNYVQNHIIMPRKKLAEQIRNLPLGYPVSWDAFLSPSKYKQFMDASKRGTNSLNKEMRKLLGTVFAWEKNDTHTPPDPLAVNILTYGWKQPPDELSQYYESLANYYYYK